MALQSMLSSTLSCFLSFLSCLHSYGFYAFFLSKVKWTFHEKKIQTFFAHFSSYLLFHADFCLSFWSRTSECSAGWPEMHGQCWDHKLLPQLAENILNSQSIFLLLSLHDCSSWYLCRDSSCSHLSNFHSVIQPLLPDILFHLLAYCPD